MAIKNEPYVCECGIELIDQSKSKIDRHIKSSKHAILMCTHHWIIEQASGPRSGGTCTKCGSAKDFFNSLQSATGWYEANERKQRKSEEIKEELVKIYT